MLHGATPTTYVPTPADVWGLGIAIVGGGQYYGWNVGLAAGTVSFGLGVIVMGTAYMCLVLSLAEIASALPFAGGVYGLARCTLGFYLGFLMGCCEILEYTMYATCGAVSVARMVAAHGAWLMPFEPLMWAVTFAALVALLRVGGRHFWRCNVVLTMTSLVVIFLYLMSGVSYANLPVHSGGADYMVVGGAVQFLRSLPHAAWFYSGIEAVNTFANDVPDPKRIIPLGQLTSLFTLLATSASVYLTCISFPPGVASLPRAVLALNGGFSTSFNVTEPTAMLMSLPATIATMPGLILAASNILAALARSKLIPPLLAHRHPTYKTPCHAIYVTVLVSFAPCFFSHFVDGFESTMYHVGMAFGFVSYIAQCVSYIYLKRRHQLLKRQFLSPVGVPGAIFAIGVFGMSMVSILFCQNDSLPCLGLCAAIVVVMSLYYHWIARHRQMFSTEERALLFFAHLAKQKHEAKRPVQRWHYRLKATQWGPQWRGTFSSKVQSIVPTHHDPRLNNRITPLPTLP
ncbi:hypothetical protein DYB32_008896 [Aphanomyces invadans]|uniref:Amino acid permease/ SLC12A domain-containing protein n=1 Tax=Aphanomyces invadans TaxID=157072 RepID=A0A3R6VG00_9STRA|nr:hypothetical protein DYB32_008896 [Aphanomyces invadans]